MTLKEWNKLSEKQQEIVVSENEYRSIDIYDESGKEANPVPEYEHCIVYFHSNNRDNDGWLEIHEADEMGLEALIAQSWILFKDLQS